MFFLIGAILLIAVFTFSEARMNDMTIIEYVKHRAGAHDADHLAFDEWEPPRGYSLGEKQEDPEVPVSDQIDKLEERVTHPFRREAR